MLPVLAVPAVQNLKTLEILPAPVAPAEQNLKKLVDVRTVSKCVCTAESTALGALSTVGTK